MEGRSPNYNNIEECPYDITEDVQERLDNNFRYHSPKRDQIERYPHIRKEAKKLAETICLLTPGSPEQLVALTKLEEAVMWANAAIARNE